jgi:hypothetical protein
MLSWRATHTCAFCKLTQRAECDLAFDFGALVLQCVDDERQELVDVRHHVLRTDGRQFAESCQHRRCHARVGILQLRKQSVDDWFHVWFDKALRRTNQMPEHPSALFLIPAISAEL